MTWFFLAFATAVCSAVEVALAKRWYGDLHPVEMLGVQLFFSLPFLALGYLFIEMPPLQPGYWTTFSILLPVNVLASFLVFAGVKYSPLSLTVPFQALTPLVALVPAFFILGEVPSWLGLSGILLVVAGGYVLNLETVRGDGIWGPMKAIARERGTRYMLGAAVLFGLAAVQGKDLSLKSSVLWAALTFFTAHNLVIIGIIAATRAGGIKRLCSLYKPGLLIAVIWAVHIYCHFTAVMEVDVAYMISIKRLNGLIAVLLGGVLFREANMLQRLMGAACMSAGAGVLAIWA